ncbi:hypothetical protein NE237_032204 [Protea cynaroides]|uniref:Gnk2-homologous domain-containing protein n=1 Tax=Protea cynaroides TaxID=273540 RepID=A0A9Q0L2M9_9MAGN|nr:hypothetical protein NE237_032204 [Protea cynaroides]
MDGLVTQAAFGSSSRMYAAGAANYISSLEKVYGLVQCTPDISQNDCYRCLTQAEVDITVLGINKQQGGRILMPSCNLRYELDDPFYEPIAAPPPPSHPPASLPAAPPSPSHPPASPAAPPPPPPSSPAAPPPPPPSSPAAPPPPPPSSPAAPPPPPPSSPAAPPPPPASSPAAPPPPPAPSPAAPPPPPTPSPVAPPPPPTPSLHATSFALPPPMNNTITKGMSFKSSTQ